MKKAQNASNHEKALDELVKRYEKRGEAYNKSPEYAEQQSREMEMRANLRKSNKTSTQEIENLRGDKTVASRRSNSSDDDDFAEYYRASREYTPSTTAEPDAFVMMHGMEQSGYTKKSNMNNKDSNDIKAKLREEADRTNPKGTDKASAPSENEEAGKKTSKIKEAAKVAAKTWLPVEDRKSENIVKGGKNKIPVTLILAIIVIMLSLLMIVGSAVLLSSAKREQNDLKDKISEIDTEISELRTDLDKKNAEADIEKFATEELGMISKEHVNFEYINSNKTDELEKEEIKKVSFGSLMKWIFQQFK